MLISEKVTELTEAKKRRKEEISNENDFLLTQLNTFSKAKLKRINQMIYDVTEKLEYDSGWIYSPSSFTLKTNYQYNPDNTEITFDLVTVVKGETSYEALDPSNAYAQKFLKKYQEILKRLFVLEEKRESYLKPLYDSYKQIMTTFNQHVESKDSSKPSYLEIASKQFLNHYGEEGVFRLVSLLNELIDSPYTNPIDIYNNQFQKHMTYMYVDELFRWASSFTPRAQYISDYVNRKRNVTNEDILIENNSLLF